MTRLLLPLLALLVLVAPAQAQALDTFERIKVPVMGGTEQIAVEIARPAGATNVPIILTYSPYNTLDESPGGNLADDAIYAKFGPKGYARARADVLGTRNSTGCWDYGGPKEQQSGVDLVNALAGRSWSNGRVSMIGGSYDGTTANMVAARGAEVPGLASIVPQLAISRWYGYAYQDGVRYAGNSERPTDEGIDTPLAFDFGLTRTPPTNPDSIDVLLRGRLNPCDAALHTQKGYDRTPDYDGFWRERDYLKDAANFRVPVLVTHGWQDYNVKQSEGTDLFEALGPNTPFKKLFVYQAGHANPSQAEYGTLLERFFARTLKGEQNGIEDEPAVWTEGRTATEKVKLRTERTWPPPGTALQGLTLGRSAAGGTLGGEGRGSDASYTDTATSTEETARQSPSSERSWLFYASQPLTGDARIAGSAILDATVKVNRDHAHLTPTLVDIAPNGSARTISRGFLNLLYRDGLAAAKPLPAGKNVRVQARFAPQDQTVRSGHRIGVVVASSNTVWALPDDPGAQVSVVHGGASQLVLPLVGPERSVPGAVPTTIGGSPSTGSRTGSRTGRAGARKRCQKRLVFRIRRFGRRTLTAGGCTRLKGRRVIIRLKRAGRRGVRRHVIPSRLGTFKITFRRIPRNRAVRVTAQLAGTKTKVARRLAAGRRG